MNGRETVSPRADLVGGIAWIAFGLAIVATSLVMDRLEQFGATVSTAPGLVPGLLGATLVVLGMVLAARALRAGAWDGVRETWRLAPEGRHAAKRAAMATALALVYTLALVGHVWFPIATSAFVFAFVLVFDAWDRPQRTWRRRIALAAITSVATAAIVTLVFEQVFLVRLP